MENKYYTPSIEEFHHGFIVQTDMDVIYDNHHGVCDLGELLHVFRVKYLDKEDIESLGWTYDNNLGDKVSDVGFIVEPGVVLFQPLPKPFVQYQLLYNTETHFLWIERTVDSGIGKEDMLFRGIIKNKSELKLLMKQIGIK